ncbi:MAG: hypothetical protein K2P14_08760 [Anaeroplasmataceae bacterium]|jgi:hypothetical protein|nr:hypothetical protein [Anaeroplasmataceae bacterium]
MSNELEKSASPFIEETELKQIKTEMMRYRANSLSYWLGFGAIIFSVFASFISLNSFQPNSVLVVVKILLNVVILLFGFLSCEKTKAYSKNSSIALIAIGGVCIARIFWVPLQIFIYFNKFIVANEALNNNANDQAAKDIINECAKYLGKPITDYYSGDRGAQHWLPADGNFRAILAIVLLSCAAALFISAGVYGYIRSVKLRNYMSSINQKN